MALNKHPKKLKDDSIIESTYEVRFDSTDQPELVTARLSDNTPWMEKNYTITRLPIADIPNPIRDSDPQLKYQTILEFRNPDGPHSIKIGSNAIVFHLIDDYLGWDSFRSDLHDINQIIFERINGITIKRLGFRYVNAMTSDRHHIKNMNCLDMAIKVGGSSIEEKSSLAYIEIRSKSHSVLTKVVSPAFATRPVPDNTTAIIDIDVSTSSESIIENNSEYVNNWLDEAHEFEKDAYFGLIPDDIIEKLKEK